jgi:hypothetical protein
MREGGRALSTMAALGVVPGFLSSLTYTFSSVHRLYFNPSTSTSEKGVPVEEPTLAGSAAILGVVPYRGAILHP